MPDPELHPSFLAAIRQEREALNARFAARRLAGVPLDGEALLAHLRTAVEPTVRAVHAVFPERTRSVVVSLYDASLDLMAASLLGPRAKLPWVGRLWREVLPMAPRLVAREPLRVAGCLSNAAAHLAWQQGARPEAWIQRMAAVTPHCESVSQLLDCGRVAAWQAGAVQYRSAALRTALALAAPAAARALGLPPDTPADLLSAAVRRLQVNPWLTIEAALRGEPSDTPPQDVAHVGAFRGFGGEFRRPPTVSLHEGHLFVTDGQSTWQLLADAYGTLLLRAGDGPRPSPGNQGNPDIAVADDGTVRWGKKRAQFAHLAAATSFASDGSTLAVTTATSHHVFLVGKPGSTP